MPPFLLHPPRRQKVIKALLGEKILRSIESILEGEKFDQTLSLTNRPLCLKSTLFIRYPCLQTALHPFELCSNNVFKC